MTTPFISKGPTPGRVRLDPQTLVRHVIGRFGAEPSFIEQLRFSPFLVQMVVTRACNLRCAYCNEYSPQGREVPLSQLHAQLDKARALGALAVEFTGGEPLLHPELIAAVCHATALGFPARMLISNAYLMTEEKILALNEAGLTELQVSVDGRYGNEMTHKVLSVVEEKLRLIARLARFRVQLSGVIGACGPEEVLAMVDVARELGFIPRILVIHDDEGQIKADQANLLVLDEAKRRMGRRFSESGGYRERLLAAQPAPFKCRAGARYLYVDEYGLVHWCSQKKSLFAKPLLDYTSADLAAQFHTPKPCTDYCTVGCVRSTSAYDEWRRQKADRR